MDRKTVLAVAVLALVLGAGGAGLAVVKPAMEKRDQLRAEQMRLVAERTTLGGEVRVLEGQLHGMAMSTISYFDVSVETDPLRTVEAKTVETLKSLTEIFNDHNIKVQSLEPKGETTGANKPIPTPKPTVAPAGLVKDDTISLQTRSLPMLRISGNRIWPILLFYKFCNRSFSACFHLCHINSISPGIRQGQLDLIIACIGIH